MPTRPLIELIEAPVWALREEEGGRCSAWEWKRAYDPLVLLPTLPWIDLQEAPVRARLCCWVGVRKTRSGNHMSAR